MLITSGTLRVTYKIKVPRKKKKAYFLSWNSGPEEPSPIWILKNVRHKPCQQTHTVQD